MNVKFSYIFIVLYSVPTISPPGNAQTPESFTSIGEVPSQTPVSNNENENEHVERDTSGLDRMFWVLRNSSSQSTTQEADDGTGSAENTESTSEGATTEMNEIEKSEVFSDPVWTEQNLMNEKIFLTRNNCDIEVGINEWEDKKLKIEYGSTGTNTSGQCHTTVYGKGGLLLALLVTDIRFGGESGNRSGEILRIVRRSNDFNFTLIEYRGNERYYPVILADSDRVSIVLYYNATGSTTSRTGFNLEVFNYYKNPIRTLAQDEPYGYSGTNINDIFLTTNGP